MLSWPQSGVTLVTPGEPRVEKDDGPALAHGTPVLLVLLRYLLDHAYALLRTLHQGIWVFDVFKHYTSRIARQVQMRAANADVRSGWFLSHSFIVLHRHTYHMRQLDA